MSKKLLKKKSNIKNAGNGLFAKKIFYKGDIVCEYAGKIMTKEETFESYQLDYNNYIKKIHPYVRDLSDTKVVVGKEYPGNLYKSGVLVNDASILKTDLARLEKASDEEKDMINYVKESLKKSNVDIFVKDNKAYYKTIKKIRKGDEILTHYGIAYWLLHNGINAEMIANINRDMGGFEKFYSGL